MNLNIKLLYYKSIIIAFLQFYFGSNVACKSPMMTYDIEIDMKNFYNFQHSGEYLPRKTDSSLKKNFDSNSYLYEKTRTIQDLL